MRVLVSGATGFIGTALTRHLLEHGHDVVRLVRRGHARPASNKSARWTTGSTRAAPVDVMWDPEGATIDLTALDAAGPYDGIVNLAGAGIGDRRWSPARKDLVLRSRTLSTRTLVDAATRLAPRPPVLVSASAVGYYGDRGGTELTESSPAGVGFLAEVCTAWEGAAQAGRDASMRVVLLRNGIVLGQGGGVLGKQLPLFRLGLGGRLGPGDQYVSWVTLDDVVGVIMRALADGNIDGAVNVTAPEPVTNAQFSHALADAVHRPCLLAVPKVALELALGRQLAGELLLASQRVLPEKLSAAGFAFAHPDLPGALSAVLS